MTSFRTLLTTCAALAATSGLAAATLTVDLTDDATHKTTSVQIPLTRGQVSTWKSADYSTRDYPMVDTTTTDAHGVTKITKQHTVSYWFGTVITAHLLTSDIVAIRYTSHHFVRDQASPDKVNKLPVVDVREFTSDVRDGGSVRGFSTPTLTIHLAP